MSENVTDSGRMSMADHARKYFSRHYEIMRKYHTQVERIRKGTVSKNNKTGRTGVWFNPKRGCHEAYITIHRKKIHLGSFENYIDAVQAREQAEHEYFDPIIAAIDEEFG